MRRLVVLVALVARGATGEGPDNRLKQIMYAMKAAERGGLVLAIEACDGCVLASCGGPAEGPSWASGDDGEAEKIAKIAPNVALGHSGLSGDARQAVGKARLAAVSWWMKYGITPTADVVAEAVADAACAFDGFDRLFSGSDDPEDRPARPLGCAFLAAGWFRGRGASVLHVDPAGAPRRWRAKAIGAGATEADELLSAELHHVADVRGLAFPRFEEPAPWSLADAIPVAAAVADAASRSGTKKRALRLVVIRRGSVEEAAAAEAPSDDAEKAWDLAAEPEFNSDTFDDRWDSPGGPTFERLDDDAFAAALASRLREPVADLEEREPKATYALYDLVAGEPEKVTYGYLEDDVAALETEDDILETKT